MEKGENASALVAGSRKFIVEFPTDKPRRAPAKENNRNENERARTRKTPSTQKKKKTTGEAKPVASSTSTILCLDSDSTDDEMLKSQLPSSDSKSGTPSLLPSKATQELVQVIKKLVTNWAEEERLMGKSVFYWNILSNEAMKSIASQAPTTLGDLKGIGSLGENIVKVYGDRIVKVVKTFVETNDLIQYVNERPSKRAKMEGGVEVDKTKPVLQINSNVNAADHDLIEIPDSTPSVADKSKFF